MTAGVIDWSGIDLGHDKCSTLPLSHLLNLRARLLGVVEFLFDRKKRTKQVFDKSSVRAPASLGLKGSLCWTIDCYRFMNVGKDAPIFSALKTRSIVFHYKGGSQV